MFRGRHRGHHGGGMPPPPPPPPGYHGYHHYDSSPSDDYDDSHRVGAIWLKVILFIVGLALIHTLVGFVLVVLR